MSYVVNQIDTVTIIDDQSKAIAEFFICDDCHKAYLGPAYYTFDPIDCYLDTGNHDNCTGNSCHECIGDDTYPDDEEDPRWNRPAHLT